MAYPSSVLLARRIVTPARTSNLTTLEAVKDALRLADEQDAALERLLRRYIVEASRAIVEYCQQPFARAVYQETVPAFDSQHLQVTQTPIGGVTEVLSDAGLVMSNYYIAHAEAGLICRADGWHNALDEQTIDAPMMSYDVTYAAGYLLPDDDHVLGTLSVDGSDQSLHDSARRLPLLMPGDVVTLTDFLFPANAGEGLVVSCTRDQLVLSGLALQTEPVGAITYLQATTLSLQASDQTLHDTAAQLGQLSEGMTVELNGCIEAENNGTATVISATATAVTLDGLMVVDESAGAVITLTLVHNGSGNLQVRTLPPDLELACIQTVATWYRQRQQDMINPRVEVMADGARVFSGPGGALPREVTELLKTWKRKR